MQDNEVDTLVAGMHVRGLVEQFAPGMPIARKCACFLRDRTAGANACMQVR